jgi:hypothetical protein
MRGFNLLNRKLFYLLIIVFMISAVNVFALTLNNPANNDRVSGLVNLNATITNATLTTNVSFYVNNTLLNTQQNTANASNYNFTWNSSTLADGTYTLNVTENDDSTVSSITILVNNVNEAPNITSSPTLTGKEKTAYQYQVAATDVDNDILTYSLAGAPTGMSISNSSGLITWTPDFGQNGTYNLTVTVSDSQLTDTQDYNLTIASKSKLEIQKIELKIDGKKDTLFNGESSRNAAPGDSIKVEVTVANLFSSATKIDIENIEVEGILKDIDDGEDLDDDDEINVDAGEDKKAKLSFDIPLNVDEDNYRLDITARGRGTNSVTYNDSVTIYIVVDKKSHDLRIIKASLSPETITCSRETVLNLVVYNLGTDDEEDTVITINSPELEYYKTENLEMEEGTGDSDDDSSFSRLYPIKVQENVKNGIYHINVRVYYDTDHLDDEETLSVTVEDCVEDKTKETMQETQSDNEVEVIYTDKPTTKKTTPEVVPVVKKEAKSSLTKWIVIGGVLFVGLLTFIAAAAIINKQ